MSGPRRPRERVETERLVLERARSGHAREIFESYARDERVARWLLWKPHETPEETRSFLEEKEREWDEGRGFVWAIRERAGDTAGDAMEPAGAGARRAGSAGAGPAVGMIGLHPGEETDQLGFVLARGRWGRGYMTEALRAVLDEAVTGLAMPEVRATTHPENRASMRVMEKAGMRRSGFEPRHHVFPNLGPEPVGCYRYVYRPEGRAGIRHG